MDPPGLARRMLRGGDMIALVLGFALEALQKRAAPRAPRRKAPFAVAGIMLERKVTEAYASRVIALEEPAARNLLITQAYRDLSIEFADLIGCGAAINWCTMAAWASRRAGQTIRMEDVPGQQLVARALGLMPKAEKLREALEQVSREVAEGNREVFAEVAPSFAGFVRAFRAGEAALEQFFSAFKRGAANHGGQDMLRRAFERYNEAASIPWCKRKAELVHLGNLYVALQEQTRLQHRIAAAMPGGPRSRSLVTRTYLAFECGGIATHRLGADLPDSPFAEHLRHLEDEELISLTHRYDADPISTRGSGADRWDSLEDRMRFIVDLFRLHGSDPTLFEEPITAAEWLAFTGKVRPRV